MKIQGIVIDAKAIAKGLYAMLPDEYKKSLTFGLLPLPIFEQLKTMLGEKFDQLNEDEFQFRIETLSFNEEYVKDVKEEYKEQRKRFVKESERAIVLEMYKLVPMVV